MWRTATPLLLAACGLLAACASGPATDASAPAAAPGAEPGSADWWGGGAAKAADATARAADATWRATALAARGIGAGLGEAYDGVSNGFDAPPPGADFGPVPEDFAITVRKHFERVLRIPETASYRFGRPTRGYMTQGIFRGGDVEWWGFLLDVEVQLEPSALSGKRRPRPYVVRMRDGEIIDVHKGRDQPFLHRM